MKVKEKKRPPGRPGKNKGGRPTKMTEDTLAKLEDAFSCGCTDEEACLYADISMTTLYRYQEDNPKFRDRKLLLKQNPVMKARRVLMEDLEENKDKNTARYLIDKADGKAKQAVQLSGDQDNPIKTETKWEIHIVDSAETTDTEEA